MSFSSPEDLHTTFSNAMEAKDVEALIDLYEADAIGVMPDGTRLTDSDARRAMFEGLVAADMGMQGTQRKTLIADDIALTSTTYEVEPGQAGDQAATVVTAEVSRRQPDGSWRVVIDDPNFS